MAGWVAEETNVFIRQSRKGVGPSPVAGGKKKKGEKKRSPEIRPYAIIRNRTPKTSQKYRDQKPMYQ